MILPDYPIMKAIFFNFFGGVPRRAGVKNVLLEKEASEEYTLILTQKK